MIYHYYLIVAVISSPQSDYKLFRNPRFKNVGKFLTLSEFLAMAKNASSLHGVLISIEVNSCHSIFFLFKFQVSCIGVYCVTFILLLTLLNLMMDVKRLGTVNGGYGYLLCQGVLLA